MPFYKRQDNELLQSINGIEGPGYSLNTENHNEYSYPVHGWYWFDNLDQAMDMLPRTNVTENTHESVSALQLNIALVHYNLYDLVEQNIQQSDIVTQLAWKKATLFNRNSNLLNSFAASINISQEKIDEIFQFASKVKL